MPGRARAILAAAALAPVAVGAAAAGADGGGAVGGPRGPGAAAPLARSGATPAERRVEGGVCELDRVDRATTPSARCIACHDGTAGATIEYNTRPGGIGTGHPVEVDYGAAVAREPGRYHPAATLPREIPLVNGKVACTSCHDGASPDPKRVVRVARLCESCHEL